MKKESRSRNIFSSDKQLAAKDRLLELYEHTPVPPRDILSNLGLYTRSVMLAKTLYLNELYQRILPIPGVIMEFGVWFGANLTLLSNFRNVYEPYNNNRKVIGFDTFEGHASISKKDGGSEYVTELTGKTGTYAVPGGYEDYLAAMFEAHAQDNVLPQVRKYEIVKGNVVKTIGQYLRDNPETIVALAYFDLALYEPTKKCLEAVLPHCVRGSVLAIDELNAHHYPGETLAVRDVLGLSKYQILKSRFLHDRSYIIIE